MFLKSLKETLSYFLIRLLTFPCRFMSYAMIHRVGNIIGLLSFYFLTEYRKRALSNLALAEDLHLTAEQALRAAKKSFQNLAINCLEYEKFAAEKDFSRIITCENPDAADKLYSEGKGIIFFCAHQSNWEVLFLDGTCRMKGVAIGKSIKNKRLYRWILSIREKNGGKIITPKNALREGLKALKAGVFMGIVGDQSMPNSGYSFPFLGRRAWTSTAPAILSYKTNSPIIVATTRREKGRYFIHYSEAIWPNLEHTLEQEVVRLMDQALFLLQQSIKRSLGEWLWQHNRWKQQTPRNIYKRFRKDSVCIILPEEPDEFEKIRPHHLPLKEIYAPDFLFLIIPSAFKHLLLIPSDGRYFYKKREETLLYDYRFKLIFNFTSFKKIRSHYRRLSVFETLTIADLKKIALPHLKPGEEENLSVIFKKALCRPGKI